MDAEARTLLHLPDAILIGVMAQLPVVCLAPLLSTCCTFRQLAAEDVRQRLASSALRLPPAVQRHQSLLANVLWVGTMLPPALAALETYDEAHGGAPKQQLVDTVQSALDKISLQHLLSPASCFIRRLSATDGDDEEEREPWSCTRPYADVLYETELLIDGAVTLHFAVCAARAVPRCRSVALIASTEAGLLGCAKECTFGEEQWLGALRWREQRELRHCDGEICALQSVELEGWMRVLRDSRGIWQAALAMESLVTQARATADALATGGSDDDDEDTQVRRLTSTCPTTTRNQADRNQWLSHSDPRVLSIPTHGRRCTTSRRPISRCSRSPRASLG